MNYRPWTEDEFDTLRRLFADTSNQDLSKMMGRSPDTISHKGKKLGLKKSPELMRKLQLASVKSAQAGWDAAVRRKDKAEKEAKPKSGRVIASGIVTSEGNVTIHRMSV